jgi:hypothetical protein
MSRVALTLCCLFVLASCQKIAGIPDTRLPPNGEGDGGAKPGACASFCELALELCTEEFTIYQSPAVCETACALYSDEDRKCREDELKDLQAANSENERYLYCPRASIGGGGKCGGSLCKNYCNAMAVACSDYVEDNVVYPDADGTHGESCEAKCAVIPDKEKARLGAGASTFDIDADHEGDTIQCRLVHLTLATEEVFAQEHCPHAYISPQPMNGNRPPWCGGPEVPDARQTCEDYCTVNLAACQDEFKVYDDLAQCRKACEAFEPGDLAVNKGNNTACRKLHSYNAAVYANPRAHCPHAGPGGAGVCGDDCESLCQLLEQACPAEYDSEYGGSASTCRSECDSARKADPNYKDNGADYSIANAKRGHAFACRLYNATLAGPMSNDAADLCAVAVGKKECQLDEDD